MKQLLFLLLFPCFAFAQYPGNANQKITLGEQTTADGLVYRGVAADTTRKPSVDTMAYILLDTNTNIIWQYKKATSNAWLRLNLLPSDTTSMLTNYYRAGRNTIIQAADVPTLNQNTTGSAATLTTGRTIQTNLASTSSASFNGSANITPGVTGTLPVANGGTGQSTLTANKVMVGNGTGTVITPSTLSWSGTTNENRLGIGTTTPMATLHLYSNIPYFYFDDNSSSGTKKRTYFFAGDVGVDQTLVYGFANLDHTSQIDVFSINELGKSGIGTIAPTEVLHVVGNARITGNIAAGVTSATARLHLAAGTATASTAPLKFTSGTNLTTAEAGAMEFNGTNLFFSPSTTRHTVNHGLTGSATLDFPSTTTLLSADLTITVTGAADGDVVSLGVPNAAVNANTCYTAWVSSANTVTIRFNNYSSGTVNPASGTFKVFVTK